MTAARILIIEDERIVAEVLRLPLIKIGYKTAGSTATGKDAVRLTRGQFSSDPDRYHTYRENETGSLPQKRDGNFQGFR